MQYEQSKVYRSQNQSSRELDMKEGKTGMKYFLGMIVRYPVYS